jgi:hypothetical protein
MPESVDSTQLNRRETYRALGEHPGCLVHLAHPRHSGRNPKIRFCASYWCERGDSNPHALRRQILSLVRLPIPPLSHALVSIVYQHSPIAAWSLWGKLWGVFLPSPLSRLVAQNLSTRRHRDVATLISLGHLIGSNPRGILGSSLAGRLANGFEVVADKTNCLPNVVVRAGFRILIDNGSPM